MGSLVLTANRDVSRPRIKCEQDLHDPDPPLRDSYRSTI